MLCSYAWYYHACLVLSRTFRIISQIDRMTEVVNVLHTDNRNFSCKLSSPVDRYIGFYKFWVSLAIFFQLFLFAGFLICNVLVYYSIWCQFWLSPKPNISNCIVLRLYTGPDSSKWCIWQENEKYLSHYWHPSWHLRILWRWYCGCIEGNEIMKMSVN